MSQHQPMPRESECTELWQWKIRAQELEKRWSDCSRACARMQGERDAALAHVRAEPEGDVVVTKTQDGRIVAVTRQDEEGRILSVIAEADPAHVKAEQGEPVVRVIRNSAGQISLQTMDGGPFNMSMFVGCTLYTHPQPVSGAADPVGLPAGEPTGPVSAAPTLKNADIVALGRDAFGIDPALDGNLMRFARDIEAAIRAKAK